MTTGINKQVGYWNPKFGKGDKVIDRPLIYLGYDALANDR